MGVGSWLSRFIEKEVARKFVEIELAVAILGGFSAPILFLSFANLSYFAVVLYGIVFAIGTLVGLEIPLLMRILKDELDFKDLVSRVLAFDYIGALAASLIISAFSRPETRSDANFPAVRNDQCSGRHLGNFSARTADKKRHQFFARQRFYFNSSTVDRLYQSRFFDFIGGRFDVC